MEKKVQSEIDDRRVGDRSPIEGAIDVHIPAIDIRGPSGNISETGVYFTATGSIPVELRLPGSEQTVKGQIVRVGAVREGEFGFAIRIDDPDHA